MLVWWNRDQQEHKLSLVAANFDAATINQVAEMMKNLRHKLAGKEPSVSNSSQNPSCLERERWNKHCRFVNEMLNGEKHWNICWHITW
jgi:hypothetical protein